MAIKTYLPESLGLCLDIAIKDFFECLEDFMYIYETHHIHTPCKRDKTGAPVVPGKTNVLINMSGAVLAKSFNYDPKKKFKYDDVSDLDGDRLRAIESLRRFELYNAFEYMYGRKKGDISIPEVKVLDSILKKFGQGERWHATYNSPSNEKAYRWLALYLNNINI